MNWFAPLRRLTAQSTLLALMLVALVVRGAVPDGYMLDTDASGAIVIRMCGETGGRLMLLDPQKGTLSETDDPAAGDETLPSDELGTHCPFAIASSPALPSAETFDLALAFGTPLLAGKPYLVPHQNEATRPPLPARGPPRLI